MARRPEWKSQAPAQYALSAVTMSTRYSAVFYAPHGQPAEPLARSLFEAVDRVDRQSTWKADSDLNRLNAWGFGPEATHPDCGRIHGPARDCDGVAAAGPGQRGWLFLGGGS